jgi:hypothetical protein
MTDKLQTFDSAGFRIQHNNGRILNLWPIDAAFAADVSDLTWEESAIGERYDAAWGIPMAIVSYTYRGKRYTDHAPLERVRCPCCGGDGTLPAMWRDGFRDCRACEGAGWFAFDFCGDTVKAILANLEEVFAEVYA